MPAFGKSARLAALLPLAAASLAITHSAPAAAQRNAVVRDAGLGSSIAQFYRTRGGAPLWFSPTAGPAPHQLMQLLNTAAADNLNPNRYRVRQLARAVQTASSRNPAAVQRAEVMLSEAFVTYVRDLKRDPNVGIIYVDPELRPTAPSAHTILAQAASSGSISKYLDRMGWMSPVYAQLRRALAARMYRGELERQLLVVNLERARALPSGGHRYAIVNPAAQRLYM